MSAPVFPRRPSKMTGPLVRRRMPVELQEARLVELTNLRLERRLTRDECDEQERLERLKYQRLYVRNPKRSRARTAARKGNGARK